MPKDRKSRSVSFDRQSPFRFSDSRCLSPGPSYSAPAEVSSSSSSASPDRSRVVPADKDLKEWDDVRCPVCMEQPHNSVLLICSSHDKGCRPFMCDTSYRHSNCFDQYRKACDASAFEIEGASTAKLSCPLCRGVVSDWKVVQTARKYLNTKVRNCSTETCGFSGAYGELRKHARTEHPFVRPSEADSERQQDWRRMELQRDIGDFVSSIESSIGEWDESLGFHDESRDFGGFFPMPSIGFFLILSFRGSGDLSRNTGRVSVRRGSSRSSRGQRGRARVLSGEAFSEAEASGRFQRNAEGAGGDENPEIDDDAGHEEALDASRQPQRQTQGELRMLEDDEDGTV
ncbi:uncharacterized protein LOC110096008 [Dendrobium catenatum]|uniref:Uncharacterized protein n=1 Tax=Dendrobium catenatum TaxID=906689 RepID=A0A2I0XDF7_9ASPA|nr:uncharacterized protein LOC110096008 [Dendrobium catenatum]PKU85933.1 hypothetical protein MA16_Dca001764 [Dendrobium catenatum]